MKPVFQKITKHDPENGQYGDCFRACVCSLLEISDEGVPNFGAYSHEEWWGRFQDWIKSMGYKCFYGVGSQSEPWEYTDYCIVSGKSPRGNWLHAVIYYKGKLVHDPHPDGGGVTNIVDYIWFKKVG